jgi:hypothetical protein
MAINDIYILPQTILVDIDKLIEHDFVKSKEIFSLIKQRYKGKIKFSKKDLEEYIIIRRKELKAPTLDEAGIIPLPIKVSNYIGITKDNPQDNTLAIDIRNKAQVLEFFKNKILKRVKLIETQQGDNVDPYLEALIVNYIREMHTIIEKEIKLQLEIEDSSKLDKMVEERLGLLFILIKGIINKYVDEETYEKINKDFIELFNIYGMEKIYENK